MDNTPALRLLGMAKKAGLLAIGSQQTAISARHGKARLIISAADASAGAIRRAEANALAAGSRYLAVPFTKFELGNITGRGSPGVIAVLDKGLADGFLKKLAPIPGQNPTDNPEKAVTGRESDVQ